MLLTKEIEVTLTSKQISYYEELGYDIPRTPAKWNKDVLTVPIGTKIKIDIKHLPSSSNLKIEYQCDYCEEKGVKSYHSYNKSRKIIQKDSCRKCVQKKIKETNIIKYGVEHTTQLESTKNKMKSTNLEKYGTEYASQNKEIRNKIESVFMKKYGTKTPAENVLIKEKIIKTNNEKYGGNSPSSDKAIREKQIKTLNLNFGVSHPQQNGDIKKKSMISLYKNNKAPCSRQQRYIHNLLGGEIKFSSR